MPYDEFGNPYTAYTGATQSAPKPKPKPKPQQSQPSRSRQSKNGKISGGIKASGTPKKSSSWSGSKSEPKASSGGGNLTDYQKQQIAASEAYQQAGPWSQEEGWNKGNPYGPRSWFDDDFGQWYQSAPAPKPEEEKPKPAPQQSSGGGGGGGGGSRRSYPDFKGTPEKVSDITKPGKGLESTVVTPQDKGKVPPNYIELEQGRDPFKRFKIPKNPYDLEEEIKRPSLLRKDEDDEPSLVAAA